MKRTILTLLLLGTFAARAQLRLTLDDALRLALSENPTIRMAEMEVERYDYVKRQTWGALLPQVSVSGQLNHNFIVQQMSKGFSLGNDPYTTVSGAVDASLPLFAPQVYRMLRLNAAQMASAVEAARASRIDLVAEVKKAFYNILLAEQSLAVLHESEATVRRTVEDTQLQYDHGLTSDLGENSDLRQLELQEEMLRLQLRAENAGRLPTLGAFGNFTLTGNNMGTVKFDMAGGGMSSIKDGYFWQHPLYAGGRLSVPLFAGLVKANRARELRNQIAQIALQRDYARQQLDVQLRSALNDLMTARETMFAQEKTVAQARKAYRISDTRYRAGAGTILELNSAQLAQTQAQLNYSQAIYDYLSAKAEYDRIVGREE